MKSVVIALAVFAVINSANCDMDDNPTDVYNNIHSNYLRSYLKQRQALQNLTSKVEAICPGKGHEFEGSLLKVKECVDEIEASQETMCSVIKNHFLRCTKPMVSVFEECFPKESRDIPSFIFRSIASATDYVCKSDGEHVFELMNACVMKPNYRMSRCERKIKAKAQQFRTRMPTKADLCEFVHSFKPCLQLHINHSCGHKITREAVMGLYDAMFTPCNDVNEVDSMSDVELLA